MDPSSLSKARPFLKSLTVGLLWITHGKNQPMRYDLYVMKITYTRTHTQETCRLVSRPSRHTSHASLTRFWNKMLWRDNVFENVPKTVWKERTYVPKEPFLRCERSFRLTICPPPPSTPTLFRHTKLTHDYLSWRGFWFFRNESLLPSAHLLSLYFGATPCLSLCSPFGTSLMKCVTMLWYVRYMFEKVHYKAPHFLVCVLA